MKEKILVIDDEESVRKTLEKIVSRAGYSVITASHGMEALEILRSVSVSLIMLDMNMPQMNGLDFLKRIRENEVTNAPVLMVSGTTDTDHIVECYKLGVYDFIRKPEQTEVMLKRIENGLKIGEMINFNEFIKVELLMAKKLQKYLYPEPIITTEKIDIFTWIKPLSDIGGDLYDYIIFRDHRIIFYVADVSGHSISAALYTAIVNMVFRNALQKTQDPGQIMDIMNQELSGNIPTESFVTMFCGIIDPRGLTLSYANAGHPKPYIVKDGTVEPLEGNDSFLGPIIDASYSTHVKKLEKDECLLLYTDGVVDIMDSDDNPAGNEMLVDIFSGTGAVLDKFAEVQDIIGSGEYVVHDDCTLMLVQIK